MDGQCSVTNEVSGSGKQRPLLLRKKPSRQSNVYVKFSFLGEKALSEVQEMTRRYQLAESPSATKEQLLRVNTRKEIFYHLLIGLYEYSQNNTQPQLSLPTPLGYYQYAYILSRVIEQDLYKAIAQSPSFIHEFKTRCEMLREHLRVESNYKLRLSLLKRTLTGKQIACCSEQDLTSPESLENEHMNVWQVAREAVITKKVTLVEDIEETFGDFKRIDHGNHVISHKSKQGRRSGYDIERFVVESDYKLAKWRVRIHQELKESKQYGKIIRQFKKQFGF